MGQGILGHRKLRDLTGTCMPVRHTHNADSMHPRS
jgi:hypothetical protein